MTDETTTKNLVAAVAERDRRIAELAQSLIDAAGKIDAAEARVAAAVDAERARSFRLPDGIALAVCANCKGDGMIAGVTCRVCNCIGYALTRIRKTGGAS